VLLFQLIMSNNCFNCGDALLPLFAGEDKLLLSVG
jgi:hypothetical protein